MRRPRNGRKYIQGRFNPINPQKYVGDIKNIIFRSSWELKFLTHLDLSPNIVSYASEEVVVPYYDPSTGRNRRYFPDFLVRSTDGTVSMIEIKPASEQVAPRRGKKTSKRFLNEAATYLTNTAKWDAAKRFCDDKGWKFVVLNERDLGIRPRKS